MSCKKNITLKVNDVVTRISILWCGHTFHPNCLLKKLTKSRKACPCCNNHVNYNDLVIHSGDKDLTKVLDNNLQAMWMEDTTRMLLKDSCTICQEDLKKERCSMIMKCGHTYHTQCIWKNFNNYSETCPCCRIDIKRNDIQDLPEFDENLNGVDLSFFKA